VAPVRAVTETLGNHVAGIRAVARMISLVVVVSVGFRAVIVVAVRAVVGVRLRPALVRSAVVSTVVCAGTRDNARTRARVGVHVRRIRVGCVRVGRVVIEHVGVGSGGGEEGLRCDDQTQLWPGAADRGQTRTIEAATGDVGEGVGASLGRGAVVVRAGWFHQGVKNRQQRRAGFGVELAAYGEHAAATGNGEPSPLERGFRVWFWAVGVDVCSDAFARLLQVGWSGGGGEFGHDLVKRRDCGNAQFVGQVRDSAEVFG
jgi:hypothetical protein